MLHLALAVGSGSGLVSLSLRAGQRGSLGPDNCEADARPAPGC